MLLLNLPMEQIILFFFVLVRVGAILFTIPFLEARSLPVMIKVGLAISVSWLILPQLDASPPAALSTPLTFAIGLISEVGIGLIIGLTVQLLFAGIQLGGQMAGLQMGLAIANVVDPASSVQIPLLAQFLNLFAMMIFLSMNMHYYFIMALMDGFERIPFWGGQFNGGLFELVVKLAGNTFVVAAQIGAPVMAALLLTTVALGLIARTVPQMQIFIVAMPLKILLGLLFIGFSLPFVADYLHAAFISLGKTLLGMIKLFM